MPFSNLTLQAAPGTDFWSKPPSTHSNNAPVHIISSFNSTDFHRARVTVSADWTRLYDQGGLFIFFPDLPIDNSSESGTGASTSTASTATSTHTGTPTSTKRRWLKCGIEFFHGRPNLSTVSTREWSDWSLNNLDSAEVTIEVERPPVADATKGLSTSLSVYRVNSDGVRDEVPVRKVTWAFEVEGEIQVGVYAARPTAVGDGDEEKLSVVFKDFVAE